MKPFWGDGVIISTKLNSPGCESVICHCSFLRSESNPGSISSVGKDEKTLSSIWTSLK